MQIITIQITNMVCPRCIYAVQQILNEMEIPFAEVGLGYATLKTNDFPEIEQFNDRLEALGLGLVRDQDEITVSGINDAVCKYMENINKQARHVKLSEYISMELGKNYHQLSKLYSRNAGITIEQYFIDLRTKRVKELVKQGNLNLSQIAITVGYSSIHYLSGQFKKYTGMSLSEYKKQWKEEVKSSFVKEKSKEELKGEEHSECTCENCHCKEKSLSHNGHDVAFPAISPDDKRLIKFGPSLHDIRAYKAFVSL